MKCLVLGAGGYLGSHLAQALRNAGHDVRAVARTGPGGEPVDVGDLKSLQVLDWAVDRVFMFAGVTGTTASFNQYPHFVAGNQLSLLNVLECIRQSAHRPRVVFPSTRLVYKGSEQPLPETAELEARTVYAASKIACERHLQAYANAFEIPYTVVRVCVPYGNALGGRYSYGTVGNFIQQSFDSGRIRLYGDGSLRRTFTHVEDICRAIVLGAAREDFANQVFNLPGEDLSLLQAAQLIATRLEARIELTPWPEFDQRIESGSTVFDGSRLEARLPGLVQQSFGRWVMSIPARPAPSP
jgi:UDP-glucose 4-epimerase